MYIIYTHMSEQLPRERDRAVNCVAAEGHWCQLTPYPTQRPPYHEDLEPSLWRVWLPRRPRGRGHPGAAALGAAAVRGHAPLPQLHQAAAVPGGSAGWRQSQGAFLGAYSAASFGSLLR